MCMDSPSPESDYLMHTYSIKYLSLLFALLYFGCDDDKPSGADTTSGGESAAGAESAGEAGVESAGEINAGAEAGIESAGEVNAGVETNAENAGEAGAGAEAGVESAGEEPAGAEAGGESAGEMIAGVESAGEEPAGVEMETERPDLPEGREDDFSRKSCQLLNLEMVPVIAVADRADAGQVALLPSEENAYQIRLPEGGVGYFTLEVPDWSLTVGLFTHFSQSVEVDNSSGNIEPVGRLSWNASCDDITDERLHFHSWGSYVVELRGEPNSDVEIALLKRL